eukprot:CAMPEP_0172650154 /NCGR_PEP_ID=MMETSP1068-20121228/242151_1 /TAXON_ID=35684 /ORGANISM="Pseudopedinella elastica, Strain CCMP716" /LENGTH=686 /DNA_ID=CAMNT_0013464517 /DNA_START=119 /DNA_END=2179 /DNA_ORIENTATION=+
MPNSSSRGTSDAQGQAVTAFWMLGLLNNSSFVIMIAAAVSIESGAVGIVHLSATVPGLLLKSSAPYWFDSVSYSARMAGCSVLMAAAFLLVGLATSTAGRLAGRLAGVACAAAQCGMGEASLLALASRYGPATDRPSSSGDPRAFSTASKRGGGGAASAAARRSGSGHAPIPGEGDDDDGEGGGDEEAASRESGSLARRSVHPPVSPPAPPAPPGLQQHGPGAATLTAWSSGTGFAGVFGYAWVTLLHLWLGLSFRATVLAALLLVACWVGVFFRMLPPPPEPAAFTAESAAPAAEMLPDVESAQAGAGLVSKSAGEEPGGFSEPDAASCRRAAGRREAVLVSATYGPLAYQAGTSAEEEREGAVGIIDDSGWKASTIALGGPGGGPGSLSTIAAVGSSSCLGHPRSSSRHHVGGHVGGGGLAEDSMGDSLGGDSGALLRPKEEEGRSDDGVQRGGGASSSSSSSSSRGDRSRRTRTAAAAAAEEESGGGEGVRAVRLELTARERFIFLASLWPFCVPLVLVYAAEYALQAGVWSAIGFPVSSAEARAEFYDYANWSYQLGVFVSRSSGLLVSPSARALWALPALQTALLAFFWLDAAERFWYDRSLLSLCVLAGLCGGAVYVHGFKLLAAHVPAERRELAMASASVAADLGIIFGSTAGIYIQACINEVQDVSGAEVSGAYCKGR